ncbi:MAG TPA: hypothetical protein VME24_09355 [Alphaproteobacteria bacterium]|nr:hypothetical protein [Alphaproteobacteria bacterium]
MKSIRILLVTWAVTVLAAFGAAAQITFVGANAPGNGTSYVFNIPAGVTNLSLLVSNSSTTYADLFLTPGGTPTTTSFTYVSRLVGMTNQIDLELPECVTGSYGLLVSTPAGSTTDPFNVVLTTNRPDIRSAEYPALKPLAFSTTGAITNTGAGVWNYFQVDVPSNLLTGWRVVLSCTNANPPGLYIKRNQLPSTGTYDAEVNPGQPLDTIIFPAAQATNSTYFIGVYSGSTANTNHYVLTTELASITALTWDPGTQDVGSPQTYTNTSASGGDYYFSINTQTTANQVWRTVLNVFSNQASLYLLQGSLPSTSSYNYASTLIGSNGFVLAQSQQFQPGQTWYIDVHAQPGAQWTLLTGQAYVQALPNLAADGSSGATATIGGEGIRFFSTTISSNTLAWRLYLNGLTNQMYVKETAAPVPYSTSTYDLTQPGQMLVVPTYLNVGSQYFVSVVGNPGLTVPLDSREQGVTNLAFGGTTNVIVATGGYGYTTYVVQVPVQQIAWQINVTPSSGTANVAVRENNVPNEFVNDAFSEPPSGVGASVSLVPSTLSNGTFYITVYGPGPYSITLTNGQPVITPVDYVFQITNDAPNRVGWRYYTVTNTAEQLGSLGWELDLSNQVPGTTIAIRRNAVPGQWNYRSDPYDYYGYSTEGYMDLDTTYGYLQQPNHPADIWYIGIYTPATALGNFVLTGSELTGTPVSFDGGANSFTINNQPVNKYQYFVFNVPAGALGWDLRLTNVTSGNPQMIVCLDQLPPGNGGFSQSYTAAWPNGYDWTISDDWTGLPYNFDGSYSVGRVFEDGMGNPLVPGTYYVAVGNYTGSSPMSYTIASQGIGTNYSIPVTSIAFSNGVANLSGLAARQAAYYAISVPTNATSWQVEMDTNQGQSILLIQDSWLPDSSPNNGSAWSLSGGRVMAKTGDQQYLMMPYTVSDPSNVVAGTYYLAVVSEGQNPGGSYTGSGTSGFTLHSWGPISVTNLGTVDPSGATDLVVTNPDLPAGQFSTYSFTVPPNTLALEVFLTNTIGSPIMLLRPDGWLPGGYDGYGNDGGLGYDWNSTSLINIASPTPTNYTLMVQARQSGGDAGFTVRVHAIGPITVPFDQGMVSITNQSPTLWQYFTVTVPPNALGWDLRLTNVSSGNPQMYICYEAPPPGQGGFSYSYSTSWPSNYDWTVGSDWTGLTYNPTNIYSDNNNPYSYGQVFADGMGNPLTPGLYYVGIFNLTGPSNLSYTVWSRGIGTNYSIPVKSLAFSNSMVAVSGLNPREAAYYAVSVPTNTTSWQVEVDTNVGQSILLIQKSWLPDSSANNGSAWSLSGGRVMAKTGDQQYLMMPYTSTSPSNIVAGTYYLAVVSEGQNPGGNVVGTNYSSFTLHSWGPITVTNLGTVDASGATDLVVTNPDLPAGQFSTYSFTVPPNTLALEVFLTNTTGSPLMLLRPDGWLPGGYDSYGNDGGLGYDWDSTSLINIASPTATNYTLMVQARQAGGDAGFTVRVHAIGPTALPFDEGMVSVTNQSPTLWQYFTVNVPPDAQGWDLRLTNVTSGNPQMYICYEAPPPGQGGFSYSYSTSWPSNYDWTVGSDWTGLTYNPTNIYSDNNNPYSYGQVFADGMGNPLTPGLYYVGVFNLTGPSNLTYTVWSRGIGTNYSIPVTPLAFSNGTVTVSGLNPREASYYSVVVASNMPTWQVEVSNIVGQSMLVMQKGPLPDSSPNNGAAYNLSGGRVMDIPGNQQYLQLPQNGQTNIVGGTYYLAVVSEGQNPAGNVVGSNFCSFAITSFGNAVVTNLGPVTPADIYVTNQLQGGQNGLYKFSIPSGPRAVEVRLDNVTGGPYMSLSTGTNLPTPWYGYGNDGGASVDWDSPTLITLPNPAVTNYALTVQASAYVNSTYLNADYTLHIREMPTPALVFDPSLNTVTASNVATGTLLNGESAYYQVTVPSTLNGQPVIGWVLSVTETTGTPSIRVRPGLLPDNLGEDGTSPFNTSQAIIVPPYLTPGVWYVEVNGSGITSYTLTSSALYLQRPAWTMQPVGGSVTTTGLPPAGPLFADTGVDTNGNALPGDQGTDLAEGAFDYYAIIVPTNNTGILRTRLDAISGNPNLYIRAGWAPTLSHYTYGNYGNSLYDRTLNASGGSEYGNWVPFNGRWEAALTNGIWYLAVQAAGGSNVRFRLRMDTGNITNLVLNGGGTTNQEMVAGDYLYYAVQIPTNSPVDWNITYSVQLGNVVGYIRDRVPPGQGDTVSDYRDWNYDDKNEGPYPQFTSPGTYTLTSPPLRPGNTYYVGFRAVEDSTFAIGWNTNGGYINYTNVIPFYDGHTNTIIPAYGTMLYRFDVPGNADRLNLVATNAAGVWLYLEQGAPPTLTYYDNWYSSGYANPSLTEYLQTPYYWPWQPGYSYFLAVTNTTATSQSVTLILNGEGPGSGPFGILDVHHRANGNTELDEEVVPGLTYQLQTVTNLMNATNWTILSTFIPPSSPYTNVDTTTPVMPYRFYRLIEQ